MTASRCARPRTSSREPRVATASRRSPAPRNGSNQRHAKASRSLRRSPSSSISVAALLPTPRRLPEELAMNIKAKVLAVDDAQDILDLLAFHLRAEHVTLLTAKTFDEGL